MTERKLITQENRDRALELYELFLRCKDIVYGDNIDLELEDLYMLASEGKEYVSQDPMLIKLTGPINIVGDIHGQFTDLVKLVEMGGSPEDNKYLFLGDYVDRGPNSIESICFILSMKLLWPDNIYLLRGNHESRDLGSIYGFLAECGARYGEYIFEWFIDLFNHLPLAAVINDNIFCVHGGLSPQITSLEEIEALSRPLEVSTAGVAADLVWSDPCADQDGWKSSDRGLGSLFGHDIAEEFLVDNNIQLMVRAHQAVHEGVDFPFAPDNSVMTIFSAPNYGGLSGNKAAIAHLSEDSAITFQFITPYNYVPKA